MMHRVRALVAAASAIALVTSMATPASAVNGGPTPIRARQDVWEVHMAVTADHLAWAEWPDGATGYRVVAQARSGGPTWRVNPSGTYGGGPATVPHTQTILYQQYGGNVSDLYLYDLSTKTRKPLPSKVNTSGWEYWGVASKQYVLFMRIVGKERHLLLFDRKAGTTKKLAESPEACDWCFEPQWVGADAAIYESCSRSTYVCDLKVWREGRSTLTVPGRTPGYSQYGATMDEAHDAVYFVRGTSWCGLFVELRRWTIGDAAAETLYDFEEGIEAGHVAIGPSEIPGDIDAFFDRWDCVSDESDIYTYPSIDEVLPVTSAAVTAPSPSLSGRRPSSGPEAG